MLTLSPAGLKAPGLDRTIPWDSIADLDMTLNQTGILTRLLLPPEADWPQRLPGRNGIKLDAKRRIITFPIGLPRGMKPPDFAELIGRYQMAAQARRLLAETEALAPRSPSESQRAEAS
jgi:hypothetical protein